MANCKTVLSQYPKVMMRWNEEKNNEIGNDPNKIGAGTETVVWLNCDGNGKYKPHTYETTAYQAVHQGCPICSNKRVVKGINDFATTCKPENRRVIEEWDSEKITPYDVTEGAEKLINFKCPKGHKYSALLYSRTGPEHTNCPKCVRQSSISEQAIYFYVKKVFPDAINRDRTIVKFKNHASGDLDIHIPSERVAIEFDGYYHQDEKQIKRDLEKDNICKKKNIRLIRVKQVKKIVSEDSENVIYVLDTLSADRVNEMVAKVYHRLGKDAFVSEIDFMRDYEEILEGLEARPCVKSLAKARPKLARDYLPELNNGKTASDVGYTSSEPATWCCHVCGHIWQTEHVYSRSEYSTKCPKCSKLTKKADREIVQKKTLLLYRNLKDVYSDAKGYARVKTEDGVLNADIYIPSKNLAILYRVESFHTEKVLELRKNKQGSLNILEIRQTENCDTIYFDQEEQVIRVGNLSMQEFSPLVKFIFEYLGLDSTCISLDHCYEQDILDIYKIKPNCSAAKIQTILGLAHSRIEALRLKLIEEGYMKREGVPTCGKWIVLKEQYV